MDWSKAKNILIVAFVITNIFLFYNIYQGINENSFFYSIKDETIEDVINILNESNIEVKTKIPKKVPSLPVLKVKYETYDGKKIADKVLESYKEEDGKYIKSNEVIEVSHKNKLLTYERKIMSSNINKVTKEEAKKIAEDFIKKLEFNKENVVYWDTKAKDNGEYEVIYKQIYNNMFLEENTKGEDVDSELEMRLVVNNTGVIKLTRKWIIPAGTKSRAKRVIPSTKALLMGMEDIKNIAGENEKAVIKSITLGYILDIPEFDAFIKGNWYDVESGYASPYWRICLENKECIYIPAYE